MRIAVPYENGQIFQHFGHTAQFQLFDISDNAITATQIVDTNGNGHGAPAGFLAAQNVDILICGGIGGGAQTALAAAGIRLFGGVSGSTEYAVRDYLEQKLVYQPNVMCSHHSHGAGHSCGEHGCH